MGEFILPADFAPFFGDKGRRGVYFIIETIEGLAGGNN